MKAEMKPIVEMKPIRNELLSGNELEMNHGNEPEMNAKNGVEMNQKIRGCGAELYLKIYAAINDIAEQGKARLLADMLLYLCTLTEDNQRGVKWYINDEIRNRGLILCSTNTE